MNAVKTVTLLCFLTIQSRICARADSWHWHGLNSRDLREAAVEHRAHLAALAEEDSRRSVHNPLKKTCDEIKWTFYYKKPFLHMKLPVCGDAIQPKLILMRPGRSCLLDSFNLPNNVTDNCIGSLIKAEKVNEVVVIIHGFLKSLESSKWMHKIADQLINVDKTKTRAVLLVGWGHGSGALPYRDPLYYYQAAANTRYMGVTIARIITSIEESLNIRTNRLFQPVSFHCIGHSLGAHICGFTGQTLKSISHIELDRISGLDPAGPLFAIDVPYPFNWLDISPEARLNRNDARFVDVIHTDGRARFTWMVVPQYGTMTAIGHVDFYPGAGNDFGWNQPGCWQFEDIGSCSHSRSHDLYLSSLSNPCNALKTCHNSTIIPESCTTIMSNIPVMGYWVNETLSNKMFTVDTVANQPFCSAPTLNEEKKISFTNLKMLKHRKKDALKRRKKSKKPRKL